MRFIEIDHKQCTLCHQCVEKCPFDAMSLLNNKIVINEACRLCSVCIKVCPEKAINMVETKNSNTDLNLYKGITVLAEIVDNVLHPVTFELISKAHQLAQKCNQEVSVLLYGADLAKNMNALLEYGVDRIYVLEDYLINKYEIDSIATLLGEQLNLLKSNVVLIGATNYGRSLGPRIATLLHTGLTADCTALNISEQGELTQTRPAYGGNIMADILTKNHRPQMSTVRPQVFEAIKLKHKKKTEIIHLEVRLVKSRIRNLKEDKLQLTDDLKDAKRIVVAGLGVNDKEGLALVHELAKALDAVVAYTRPMIEKGVAHYSLQIGLSGRTINPDLLITCGVSGSIHFISGILAAKHIVSINTDKTADIFNISDVSIHANAYSFIPKWINAMKKEDNNV